MSHYRHLEITPTPLAQAALDVRKIRLYSARDTLFSHLTSRPAFAIHLLQSIQENDR